MGLGLKAADEVGMVGKMGQDDLNRYFPVDEGLNGAINNPKAARAKAFA